MLYNADTLGQVERQLDDRGKAITSKLTGLESRIQDEASKIDAQRETQLKAAPREHRRTISETWDRTKRKQLRDARAKMVEESQHDRDGILGKLTEYQEAIETTLSLYQSPTQVLHREGLGNARRTELQHQIEGSGPATIRSMADLALANRDLVLAAAILAVEDRRPRSKRAVDIVALSDRLVGDQVKAMQHRLEVARENISAMRDRDNAFVTGSDSPNRKIHRGLAQRRFSPSDNRDAIADSMRGQR